MLESKVWNIKVRNISRLDAFRFMVFAKGMNAISSFLKLHKTYDHSLSSNQNCLSVVVGSKLKNSKSPTPSLQHQQPRTSISQNLILDPTQAFLPDRAVEPVLSRCAGTHLQATLMPYDVQLFAVDHPCTFFTLARRTRTSGYRTFHPKLLLR